MIKKLQRKFVLISMLIIAIMTIVIFGLITYFNFKTVNSQIDQTLNFIIENDGYIQEYRTIKENLPDDVLNGSDFFTKYFYVKVDKNKNIIETNVDYDFSISNEEAKDFFEEIISEDSTEGFYSNYKYKIVNKGDYDIIVFLNCEEELDVLKSVAAKSLVVTIITLLVVFVIITRLTRSALHPIIENIENQKQFITNAGHELKTPIAVIMADVDVLEMTIGEENEWISSIKSQVNRLDVLIKSMLSLSNIQEGKQDFNPSQFCVTDLIKEALQDYKALLQNKKVKFDETKNVEINADLNMMKQLIAIFLDNAIKYTPDNGEIEIRAEKVGKSTKLEFLNTCYNAKSINVNKLFDRFYREDRSRNKNKEGYGIGLSIAKSIISTHKGKIHAFITNDNKICFRVII